MSNERRIPLDFILERHDLIWSEVDLGIKEGWLGYDDAINLAIKKIQSGSECSDEMELAGLYCDEYDEIQGVLKKLVESEGGVDFYDVKIMWLRIILSWVFKNLSRFEKPSDIVEGLYEDFGCPDEIKHLVGYNNLSKIHERSDLLTLTPEEKLIVLWKEYLDCYIPLIS